MRAATQVDMGYKGDIEDEGQKAVEENSRI